MLTITEESWNLHIEQEPNFLSTPTPTEWRIQIFKITGGRRSSRPGDRGGGGGAGLQKRFFPPFGPQFGIKIRGRRNPAPSCPSPGSAAAPNPLMSYFDILCNPPPKNANFPPYNALGTYSPPPPLQKRMFPVCPITLRIFFFPANLIFSPTTFTYILFSTQRVLFNCSFSIWLWCYYYFTNS